jgi:hypothetical protein
MISIGEQRIQSIYLHSVFRKTKMYFKKILREKFSGNSKRVCSSVSMYTFLRLSG